MTTLEIIKDLCDKYGITLSGLEKEMGYSNGSLSKSKSLSSERVYELSRKFQVPMEYLMTGEIERVNAETQKLEQKRKVLVSKERTRINTGETGIFVSNLLETERLAEVQYLPIK